MSIINLVVAAKNAYSEWRRRDKTYAELSALDDRSLADIGIHRSEIAGLVYRGTQARKRAAAAAPAPVGFGTPRQARLAGAHRWFPPF